MDRKVGHMGISASGYGLNDYTGKSYNGSPIGKTNKRDCKNSENEKKSITASDFKTQIEKFVETNKITSQDLKDDKDWRKISDVEWEDMLAGVDENIDAYKEYLEHMKELKQEAAKKAALEADSDMRATAAASASLNAEASGTVGATNDSAKEDVKGEKNWTKNLDTDDQTVLRTAKAAQAMESKAIAKYIEIQNSGAAVVSKEIVEQKLRNENEENRR